MAFEFFKESYTGSIKPISLGKGDKAVTVGGETCYPFYQFEGEMPNRPKIAMEIWDMAPEDWPEAALAPFKDVVSDTAAWAKKCVDEFGAEMLVLQLKSTDPNGQDASPADAVSAEAGFALFLEAVFVELWFDAADCCDRKRSGIGSPVTHPDAIAAAARRTIPDLNNAMQECLPICAVSTKCNAGHIIVSFMTQCISHDASRLSSDWRGHTITPFRPAGIPARG